MRTGLLLASLFWAVIAIAQTGITWQTPKNVAISSYSNEHPRIVLNGDNNPLVLFGNSSSNKAYFSRWTGSTFTMPMAINPSETPVFAASWAGPDIAAKGDTVYVVYKQTPEDLGNIYLKRSVDGGLTFSAQAQVDFINDSVCRFPTVTAAENGNPLVGFMKFNPDFSGAHWVVTKSADLGNTFSKEVMASKYSGDEVCDCCPGSIVANQNKVAMLYRDNLSNIRDTWVGVSTDDGTSFPVGMGVDQQNWMLMMCPSSGPDGVIIGDTLYSVFMNGASGKNLIYSNINSLSDVASSTSQLVTANTTGITQQNYPRIANYNYAVAQVWKQIRNNQTEICLNFTTDSRNGFAANYEVVATSSSNSLANADVTIANGEVHVVWQDDNAGTVKYRKGTFVPTTGILENIAQAPIAVYPNPAQNQVKLVLSLPANFTVFNTLGQPILAQSTRNTNELTLDTSLWPNGLYFVRTTDGKEVSSRSFVVNHE